MMDTDCRTNEASSGDEVFTIPRKVNVKRRKRTISSSTTSCSAATICSDKEAELQRTENKAKSSTSGKVRKKLPTEEERMAELENIPTANLAANMLEAAASLEQISATAGNLKGTYVRRIRDDAGKVRANTTELVKRTTVAGAQVALEKENSQLRAALNQALGEIDELKKRERQPAKVQSAGKNETAKGAQATEKAQTKKPKQLSTETCSRTEHSPEMAGEEQCHRAMQELKTLEKQVSALKDLVWKYTQAGQINRPQGTSQRDTSTQSRGNAGKVNKDGRERIKKEKRRADGRTPLEADHIKGDETPATRTLERDQDSAVTWSKVLGRKEKEAARKEKKRTDALARDKTPGRQRKRAPGSANEDSRKAKNPATKPAIKPPRRAAVTITVAPGSSRSCEDVLAIARKKIYLPDIGLPNVKIRHTVAGGIMVEIPGENSVAKADELADRLRRIFSGDGEIKVSRPTKRSELRISGLDATISNEEVAEAIATKCDCPVHEIRVGEIKKRSPRALGAVWVQCPSTVAKILADAGRITIGWIAARIEALRARPMTCFRCMERGHTARNCTSEQDRSKQCYNCGSEGHQAKACSATPCCPVCSADGRPAVGDILVLGDFNAKSTA